MADIKTLEDLKEFADRHFHSLKPCVRPEGWYTVEIRVMSYYDAFCISQNLIKLCLIAIDPDSAEVSKSVLHTKINPRDLLEIALQIMPSSEMEILDEIYKLVKDKDN